jgi:hypothetical protein
VSFHELSVPPQKAYRALIRAANNCGELEVRSDSQAYVIFVIRVGLGWVRVMGQLQPGSMPGMSILELRRADGRRALPHGLPERLLGYME